jgi:hypothetical protein
LNKLASLEEENLLLNEIDLIESKINERLKISHKLSFNACSTINKKQILSSNSSTSFNKNESTKSRLKQIPTPKEFFDLVNLNRSRFEKICKKISHTCSQVEVLFKEYTFLTNLTKMRFVKFHTNQSSKLLCYFSRKEERKNKIKISVAEFELTEDNRLQTSELFWKNVLVLYE